MNTDFLKMLPLPLWLAIAAIFTLIPIIINVLFAVGVANDASELERDGRKLYFVGPVAWAVVTLFGGVFVAAIYWLIHRSALREEREPGVLRQHPSSILARDEA